MRAAMQRGDIGCIDSPVQNRDRPRDVLWCADNGCFNDNFNEHDWWAYLVENAHDVSSCLFAVAPDVVGDAAATLTRSLPWLSRIRALGYPVAFVAQDGLEVRDVPWDQIDALFIGGSTSFKLGAQARVIARAARERGLWLHMGRVNSERRFRYASALGCDSADGTILTFGPDQNMRRVMSWARSEDQLTLFEATS